MGHAGNPSPDMSSTTLQVFTAFKDHFSAKSVNTEVTLLESIREIHPDQHITVTAPHFCELLSYAKAGHAQAELLKTGDSFSTERTYTAPTSRLEQGDGKLDEQVDFGYYNYHFQGTDFPFYWISWLDPVRRYPQSKAYILSPKTEVDAAGHSPSADHLITTVGKWTAQLHEEIYIFDSGMWLKNHELWAAVQSASWHDVILDPAMKSTLINDVSSFFDSRSVYEEYRVPWKRGIIFHGTPGCGKTISIKALMNSLQPQNVASLYVKSFDACQGPQTPSAPSSPKRAPWRPACSSSRTSTASSSTKCAPTS